MDLIFHADRRIKNIIHYYKMKLALIFLRELLVAMETNFLSNLLKSLMEPIIE